MADTMLNLDRYSSLFRSSSGALLRTYTRAVSDDDHNRIALLGGNEATIDTALEIALLSNSAGVVNIRPVEANEMLGTERQAALKLGAAVLMEIRVLNFLGNSRAVGVHETELKFIIDRSCVTRADIEAYYRNGIRGLISNVIDDEFNKISFTVDNATTRVSYDVVLTRNPQNGHYILSYERPSVQNSRKELSAQTLDALSSAMSTSGDFSQAAINTVHAQAALMPAVALSDNALNEIKNIIARFYTEPNQSTYTSVVEMYSVLRQALLNTQNNRYTHVTNSYVNALSALNIGLADRVAVDVRNVRSISMLTRDQQQRLIQLR